MTLWPHESVHCDGAHESISKYLKDHENTPLKKISLVSTLKTFCSSVTCLLLYHLIHTRSQCTFSSNLFHGQITQKHFNEISSPKNKKSRPWIFWSKITLKPRYFLAGEALNKMSFLGQCNVETALRPGI